MILFNKEINPEDPLFKIHLEDFHKEPNVIIHMGFNTNNLHRQNGEKHILIELEQPNRLSQYFTVG